MDFNIRPFNLLAIIYKGFSLFLSNLSLKSMWRCILRKQRNVFTVLAVFMIGFGIIIGILFPFFLSLMGVPKEIAFSPLFITLCIIAGIIVGAVNIILASAIVRSQLKKLSDSMTKVEKRLQTVASDNMDRFCDTQDCYIHNDSNDEFGKCAHAFNQLLSAFEQSMHTQSSVRQYNHMLSGELDIVSLTKKALQKVLDYSEIPFGAVYVIEEGSLKLTCSEGIKDAEKLTENSHILSVIESKKAKFIDLPDGILINGLLTDIKPSQIIVFPLINENTVIGVFVLASVDHEQNNTNQLDMFSDNLALALNNSLKHSQLQTLVAIDPLTGVYNRRFGFMRLEEEYSSAIRTNTHFGVLMLDIDHFKTINDSFGHIAGDRVLVEISNMIKIILRKHDVLIRYGGEEFVAILPGASTHDTQVVADRIRALIEQNDIKYINSRIHVTVSLGVVSFPETQISKLDDLIAFADKAMYKSKQNGRNRVSLYDDSIIKA